MGKLTKTVVLNYRWFSQFSLFGLFLCKCLDLWISKLPGAVLICMYYVPPRYSLIPFVVYEKGKIKV